LLLYKNPLSFFYDQLEVRSFGALNVDEVCDCKKLESGFIFGAKVCLKFQSVYIL